MNKFEKLIELIVNEDNSKAKKLFHDIVVEKSRTIYESLLDEEDIDDVEENEDEVDADEEGLVGEGLDITVAEAKQLLDHIDGTLKESDAGDLLQRVAEHFDVKVEGLVPVLEAAGDELLEMAYGEAEEDGFGGEDEEEFAGDEEGFGGDDEFDGGMDDEAGFAGDEMGDELGGDMEMGGEEEIEDRVVDLEDAIDELKAEFDAEFGDDGFGGDEEGGDDFGGIGDEEGAGEMDDVEDMAGDVAGDDDGEEEQTEESLVREYVEKRSPKVTTQEEDSPNTKSTVAGPNRMGGTSANILGDQKTEAGAGKVSSGSNKGAGSFQNDPKAKAGKTSFKKKETAKKADAPESKKSLLDGPKGKKS